MISDEKVEHLKKIALNSGLDPFPVVFTEVEPSTMFNVISYGLPARARHWSYGRSYEHSKKYGQMGLSKVYEIIVNNNPAYAFMLDTNTEIQNTFIVPHCYGHSDMFKNNCVFKDTDRSMVWHAAEHASRIENYIERYGLEKVEHLMDIGFALDDHIDWYKGFNRKLYPKKNIITKFRAEGEFDDFLYRKNKRKYITKQIVNKTIPPHPEKDLLWFFINYAPLEDWERDVLDIIREEAFYFYPIKVTKIMHEGWASYWHAECMYQLNLPPADFLEFARNHEKVVQPGYNNFRINPYYLGYKIFKDIEKSWDEKYGKGKGKDKIFEVRAEDDDISFIRTYLTPELVEEMKLLTYGYVKDYPDDYESEKYIEIKERLRDDVVEELIKPMYNGGVPKIVITGIGQDGVLQMRHDSDEVGTLNHRYAEKTLEYVWDLWAAPIELHTKDDDGIDIVLCFDEAGFFKRGLNEDLELDDDEENNQSKLIWMP